MDPERRRKPDSGQEHQRHDQRADDEDYEDGGPVGAVGAGKIQLAPLAGRHDLEIPLEQPALPAARTAAGKPRGEDGHLSLMGGVGTRPGAEEIDAGEQEQPHHVDEMPIPGCGLEAEMMIGLEVPGAGSEEADDEEGGSDDDVEAVEAGGHEEGRGIDAVLEVEGGVAVLEGLDAGKAETQQDGDRQALEHALAVALAQRVMGPGDS